MPLVFVVLIVLVIIFNTMESSKNDSKQSAIREKERRKTNATLEQKTLDMYMKHGYSFDDAFRKAYEDMVEMGYEPCIPREAYNKNRNGVQSSFCAYNGFFNPEEYDSFWVQQRREEAKREWQRAHPDTHINYASREEIDEMTYDNFPVTEYQYLHDIKRSTVRLSAIPVGSFIIYPGLGTCEVLAHNWIGDGAYGGTYTIRVLKTDQIITYVKIGDKKISRQGKW